MNYYPDVVAYIIAPVVAAFISWFFTRKRSSAEVEQITVSTDTVQIDNNDRAINIYKGLLDDLTERYELKFKEINEDAQEKLSRMEKHIAEVKKIYEDKIKILESQNKLLNEELQIRERLIRNLKIENKDLLERIKQLENQ